MNFILLTHPEMHCLDQSDPLLWVAYLKIKRHMNTATHITGIERKITYQWLCEQLTRESRQGRAGKQTNKEQARYLIKQMEQLGLVKRLSQPFCEGIVLQHRLAATNTVNHADRVEKPKTRDAHNPNTADFSDQINELFDYWCQVHDQPKMALSSRQRRVLLNALHEGYTEKECRQAIDGCHRSAFHRGDNPQGVRYNSLALIFRDREHIERFIRLAQLPNTQQPRHSSSSYGLDMLAEAFDAEYGSQLPEGNPFLWGKQPNPGDVYENESPDSPEPLFNPLRNIP